MINCIYNMQNIKNKFYQIHFKANNININQQFVKVKISYFQNQIVNKKNLEFQVIRFQ